ncbi:MAG: methyl-accepting chemotaxis protein [Desulfobacteraceae bacterium]|nr:MAG: methyl-accepting chemotaxis protein [Desulfobacteraceae bacterium]
MLTKCIDWIIPDDLKKDPSQYRQAKQLVTFMFVAVFFFLPNIYKWHKIGSPELTLSMIIVMGVVCILGPITLRLTGSPGLTGNGLLAALAWHFMILPVYTGGLTSSALAWNLVLPVFAAVFIGFRSMIFWSVIMLLEFVAFAVIHLKGVSLPAIALTEPQLLETRMANAFGPILAIFISLFFNERGLKFSYSLQQKALQKQRIALEKERQSQAHSEKMAENLEKVFQKVQQSAHQLARTAEEIAGRTKGNAESADEANGLMKQSEEVVRQANQSMTQLTGSMLEISEASRATSKIVKTIDGIAFQTNLLALNAAVEAARAGKTGAGFAVVAGEVRNLALRSAESAKNTEALIENTVKGIGNGAQLVTRTGAEITQVSETVGKVVELMSRIASGSADQARGIEEMKQAIGELNRLVEIKTGTK